MIPASPQLAGAKELQSLNLSGTKVDRFLLTDLTELTNLVKLDVRQTNIRPMDIESFSRSHPTISVGRLP
ncbi:MAG: hypothetical protein R3C56_42585 [Pirellulaceae bacterium]